MDYTCIFICELTEYLISAKMFVFKKKMIKSLWWSSWMAWLHFRCSVRVCFLSVSASVSPNTLNRVGYSFTFSSRKVHNSVDFFFPPNDLCFAVAGCSDSLLLLILPVNCMPARGQASPVVVGEAGRGGSATTFCGALCTPKTAPALLLPWNTSHSSDFF